MKKIFDFLLCFVLLCSLVACSFADAKEDTSPSSSSEIIKTDYSEFIARFSDTDTPEGPCYTVNITNINNETKEIEFEISYVGIKSSPLYCTDIIKAKIEEDNTVSFGWKDSWQNEGTGVLRLNPEDSSEIEILMTVTAEAEVNRATLSTHKEYRILTKK